MEPAANPKEAVQRAQFLTHDSGAPFLDWVVVAEYSLAAGNWKAI